MASNQKSHQKDRAQQVKKTKKPERQLKHQLNHQQMLDAPETLRQDDVLAAQQQLGNQIVQRALEKSERRKSLTDDQGHLRADISDAIQQRRGSGNPLTDTLRKDVGKRFKRNFEDVRIHTDEQADQLSRTINARAFTIGKDIFFKRGVFAPGSSKGRETLMHELTHVVQQSGSKGSAGRLKLGAPDSTHEQQADRIGKQNNGSESIRASSTVGSAVQTLGEEEELQMQGMEEEEELIQTQEMEEEELQMQSDVTGVVQRGKENEEVLDEENKLNYKAYNKQILGAGHISPGIRKQVEMFGGSKWDKPKSSIQTTDVETDSPTKKIEERDVSDPIQVPKNEPIKKDLGDTLTEDPIPKKEPMKELPKDPEMEDPLPKKEPLQTLPDKKDEEDPILKKESMQELPKDPEMEDPLPKKDPLQTLPDKKDEEDPILKKEPMKELPKDPEMESPLSKKVPLQTLPEKKNIEDPKNNGKNTEGEISERDKLIATLKDPTKSRDEVQDAKQKLKELHTGKKSSLMDYMFTKKSERYGDMIGERRKALKLAAQKGDKDAYAKWKSEKKFTKGAKFKRGAKKFGSFLGGLASRFTKKLTDDVSQQLFGKPEKKEEKKATPAQVGGGGGGGGYQMLEKYILENQKLKAKIAELEKE